jgi:hypothetical protein
MFAKQLIGKLAVRTKPTSYGDYSYCEDPLFIVNATETHVVVKYVKENSLAKMCDLIGKIRLFDSRWCDDGWTDYEELISSHMPISVKEAYDILNNMDN